MPSLTDLTVIVPTRNEAPNIAGFLGSLPHEVTLIVVDKSTDETRDLVRRIRPGNTTLIDCQGSLTEARQAGAQHANTRWLLFTDADIVFADDYFTRLRDCTGAAADAQVLYGPKLSCDAYRHYYRCFAAAQWLSDLVRVPAASGSNLLVAADVFAAVGGFDTRLSCNEDSELGWRLARAGFRCRFDPRLLVWATDHRRLHRGRLLKSAHTLLRCMLLYFDLVPQRWRSHDWGYWSETRT
jgi:GT2 family glycosyltransferase